MAYWVPGCRRHAPFARVKYLPGCSKQVAIGNQLNSITRQRFADLGGG